MTDQRLPSVIADQGAIEQILMNLATNARDAMPKGGALRIETRHRWFDDEHVSAHGWGTPGECVCISVADTGSGMDEETKRRIFEPFFTTKPAGAGTGLGMAMVYGLVKQQRGFVDIVSEVGEGTAVMVYFPATSGKEVVPVAETRQELPRGAETIVFIEDEASIRRAGRRALERSGYTVLVAKDGEEGLELYHGHKAEIDLVIADMVMPRMSGPQVYQEIQRDAGRAKFVFMSGYSARDVRTSISIDPTIPFLPKPWTVAEMLQKVREVLDEDTVSA